jgi:uncharacterized membrane protein YdjX (TVP38/TMEM64 family)
MKTSQKITIFIASCLIIIFFGLRISGALDAITLLNIKAQADLLRDFVHDHYYLSVLFFILFYTVIAALALPLASLVTVTGGFLFGTILGALYTNIGATIGAAVVFLLVRYSLGDSIQQRYASALATFNKRFGQQGPIFLLVARLIVIFPYFLVNMVAGLTQVPFWTFVWTTSVGILPASLAYTFAGQQLQQIHALQDIFTPRMMLAFAAIACLLLIPLLFSHLKNNRNGNHETI